MVDIGVLVGKEEMDSRGIHGRKLIEIRTGKLDLQAKESQMSFLFDLLFYE